MFCGTLANDAQIVGDALVGVVFMRNVISVIILFVLIFILHSRFLHKSFFHRSAALSANQL